MHLSDLKRCPTPELVELAEGIGIDNIGRARKQDIITQILRKQFQSGIEVYGDGTLEILSDGFGFLRSPYASYLAGPDDIYVSQTQIRRFNLRTGDSISGKVRAPKNGERYFALLKINEVNNRPTENKKKQRDVLFENLTPTFPEERYTLERGNGSTEDLSGRIIDLAAPIGKGQRALIVSPPKAGKTLLLQSIA
ncbi:MAG: transcription termination factor Rho, partial [Gammaproteobacteria bacterium]|nr:transcription termination factor Rho [Gammaproteobacteria bacterium]